MQVAFNHLFTFVNFTSRKAKLLNQRYNMQQWQPVYDFKRMKISVYFETCCFK
jgi:hypothetical protein